MISTANDVAGPDQQGPGGWDMTVLELSIFLCVFRAKEPVLVREILATVQRWFETHLPLPQIAACVQRMVGQGWLIAGGDRVKASREGRDVARSLMEGVIRMLDQGTRVIDVALMMSVLRLTKGELDSGHADV